MVDRLDEKRVAFYCLRTGRRIAGCGCLPTRRRSTWGARPWRRAGSRQSLIHLRERLTIARGPGPPRELGFCSDQPIPWPKRAAAAKIVHSTPGWALGDHPETGAHPGPSPLPRDKMPRAFSGWSADPSRLSGKGTRKPLNRHVRHALNIGAYRPPAAFPVDCAAGVGLAIPNHRQAGPTIGPASEPKPRRPSPRIPISTSPQESFNWTMIAFTHTRARLPR